MLLIGPPGAGKGTQARRLAAHFSIPHIATGDLYRREEELGTDRGKLAAEIMSTGELMPDEVTNEMVRDRLNEDDAGKGFILDGFPRTTSQVDALDAILEESGARLDSVVRIRLGNEDEFVRRLSGRRICLVCETVYHVDNAPPKVEGVCDKDGSTLVQRDDDKPESIRLRLNKYKEATQPLYDLYKQRGLLQQVDGIGTTDEVFARILEAVGA